MEPPAPAPTAYDTLRYPACPFAQTHPDRLATLATLFGITPAPVDRCRVLELGCGEGANLIPMAFGLPESRFVGVDLAAQSIARAKAMATALGLANVELHHLDLMRITPEFGEFDYVIAHGVYAWVPEPVRDQLLAICQANLAPNGVAYVSYNALPGCHLRAMMREMLLYHTRGIAEPRAKVEAARAFAGFLAEATPDGSLYRAILAEQRQHLEEFDAAHLYHDDLAEINAPLYFHEFVAHAGRHGLQYLAEAQFSAMQPVPGSAELSRAQSGFAAGDRLAYEQHLDCLKRRSFRQTLLCHREVEIDPSPEARRVAGLQIASAARPDNASPDTRSAAKETFRTPRGASATTNHPLAKSALVALAEAWPGSLGFADLVERARAGAGRGGAPGETPAADAHDLAEVILGLYGMSFVELHTCAPRLATSAGERPIASPIARLQVEQRPFVTNLRHTAVRVAGSLGRRLLQLLDGTRDRAGLVEDLTAARPAPPAEEAPAGEPRETLSRAEIATGLDAKLAELASLALLLA